MTVADAVEPEPGPSPEPTMPADLSPVPMPQPSGRLLARVPRSKSEVVLVREDLYNGAKYVQVRVWRKMGGGAWVPLYRKGFSLRAGEVEGVAALLAYLAETDQGGEGAGGPGYDDAFSAN